MPPCSRPRTQDGFVLVLVLWMLVAMAIGAAALMLWSRGRVAEVQAGRDAVDARIAMIGTRDTLLYLRAIVPPTQGGFPLAPLSEAELATRRLDEFGGSTSHRAGASCGSTARPTPRSAAWSSNCRTKPGWSVWRRRPPRRCRACSKRSDDRPATHAGSTTRCRTTSMPTVCVGSPVPRRGITVDSVCRRPRTAPWSRRVNSPGARVARVAALQLGNLGGLDVGCLFGGPEPEHGAGEPRSGAGAGVPARLRGTPPPSRRRPFLSGRDFEAQAAARLPGIGTSTSGPHPRNTCA